MRKVALILAGIALVFGVFVVMHRRSGKPESSAISITNKNGLPLAPNLTLTDLSGKTLNTLNLKGNVVVVNFWAAWCTPCADEVPEFIALQKKYQSQGLKIIGISIDDDESDLRAFCRRMSLNYPVVAGSQAIAQAYGGILGLPTTFIIGRDGHIEEKLTGATDFRKLEQDVAKLVEQRDQLSGS